VPVIAKNVPVIAHVHLPPAQNPVGSNLLQKLSRGPLRPAQGIRLRLMLTGVAVGVAVGVPVGVAVAAIYRYNNSQSTDIVTRGC
jgi:ABC-type nitrate/sulfonate/bicarbonate transport system permease component